MIEGSLKPFVICGNYNYNDCDKKIFVQYFLESKKASWIQEDLLTLKYNWIVV